MRFKQHYNIIIHLLRLKNYFSKKLNDCGVKMMKQIITLTDVEATVDKFTIGPINLAINPNTVTAIIGDNGSGKSTLLKTIIGLIHTNKGGIHLRGSNINDHHHVRRKQIAYLPQNIFGYDSFNGKNLSKLISRWYATWDERLFQQIVTDLQVPLHITFNKLSPGNQRKLSFALTIARGANLLILDEPMNNIDIP